MRRMAVVDRSLNDIPVRAFVSDFSKDDPPTVELLRIMQTRMALFGKRVGSQPALLARVRAVRRVIRPVK
jgi:hypothetical protein